MFPATYQPVQNMQGYNQQNMQGYSQQYQQPMNSGMQPSQYAQQQSVQPPSFQFGGLFRVQSIEDVYRWEIHQGEIIIFITNDGSFMLTKELGFSPMDRPIVKKFRSFDEQQETPVQNQSSSNIPDMSSYAHKSEIEDLKLEIDVLKEQIMNMRKDDKNEK